MLPHSKLLIKEWDRMIVQESREQGFGKRLLCTSRLYVPLHELGVGLKSCRIEYGKELIRVILRYIWNGNQEMETIMKLDETSTQSMWKRASRALRKITTETKITNIIQEEERKVTNC